ncbi:sodium/hydrogen exchanger [Schizopora paradoxa]|uniref:Sodium/hydrogen exchanger n=1 Tax=Schizopora paradoxa TaxID=27342 RepID=A0A0H2S3W5_9AGAM|nr:sodium/hydrogen exchanger [Schizopora paradoxa]
MNVFQDGALPIPTATPEPIAEEEEYYSSWSLFLVCVLLIISLWTSYYLQIKKIRAIHETLVSIFAGMFVGFVVRLAPGHLIREMLTFRHTLFFNLILPPIILNSGYELKQETFFRNFGSILIFAFLGTFISAVGLGVLVYIWSALGLESLELSLLECLIFGSTLSATDPVTILAIFHQYKVDPKLYNIIFGESLLNDAVSIVMYETLSQFHGTEIYVASVFHGIGIFLLSFSISMALGIFFGLFMSLTLKHSALNQFPQIESCLVALCAYTCYFFSNGLSMSGIVSLLFCGITLKHYAYHTMSRRTQRATKYLFSVLAQLSENFIFVYLGLSLFTSPPSGSKLTSYFKPLFIIITTVSVIFVRYAAVFPLSELINLFQRHARGQRTDEIPYSYQMMLFWAGLRGAVGVALAAGFRSDNAQVLRTTVLVVVVLTVVLFGGTTARMLELLGIRTGVEDDTISSDEEEATVLRNGGWYGGRRGGNGILGRYTDEGERTSRRTANGSRNQTHPYNHHDLNQGVDDSYDSDSGEVLPLATPTTHTPDARASGTTTPNGGPRTPQIGEDGKWFQTLDERYFLPLFSNATASRSFHARRARRTSGVPTGSAEGSINATPAESEDEGGQELDLRNSSARNRGGVASPAPWTPRPQPQHAASSSSDANGSGYDRRMGSPALRSPLPTSDSKFSL